MTNKFFSSVDGNHSRVASDLLSRCSRLASLSIVSRQSVLSILLLCLTLFIGVGNVLGAISANSTWTATALGNIPAGSTVIISSNNNQAISNADATSSGPSKIAISYNNTTHKISVTTAGKSLDNVVWTTAKTTNGTQFWVYGSTTKLLGLYATNQNNGVRVTTTTGGTQPAQYNEFVMGSGGKLLKYYNAGRYVGEYVSGSDFRSYNSETATNYSSSSLIFYVLDVATCSSEVDVHAGPTTHGSFELSASKVCADAPGGEISVSNINPGDCYEFDEIVATNGTPDNTNKKITGITAETTITVNFKKKTVNTYIDEIQDNGTTEDCGTHDAPTLSNKTQAQSGTCAQQHWHFAGWTTEAHKASPEGHIITGGTSMTANGTTYYAVWSKGVDNSSSKSYSLTITSSDVPSSYAGSWSAIDANEVGGTGTYSVELDGTNVMPGSQGNTGKIQFKASSTGFYNTENLGSITSITTNNTDIKYYINTASDPSSNGANGGGFFRVYNNVNNARYSSSITINFTKTTGSATFSDYICTCCEELVSINGSFNRYHLKIFHHIIMSMFISLIFKC